MGRLIRTAAIWVLAFITAGCNAAPLGTPPAPTPPLAPTPPPSPTDPGPIGPPAPDPNASATAQSSLLPPSAQPTGTTGPSAGGVWRSLEDFPAESAYEVTSVAAVDSGFVAVGFEPLPAEDYFGRRQGVIWRSADGVTWQRTVELALQYVSPFKILAFGDSLYIFGHLATCRQIIADECTDVPEAGNAVWRSTAGGAWERLPQLPSMQNGLIDNVVAGTERLVAFGATGEEELLTMLWLSADGATWTEVTHLAGLDSISAMAPLGSGFAAFGIRAALEPLTFDGFAAYSTDGVTFAIATAPPLPDTAIEDVGQGPTGYVGVGQSGTVVELLTAVALHSADGMSWSAAADTDGSFAGSELLAVHGLADGYVALGASPQADDFTDLVGKSWFSPDGVNWTALEELSGPFSQFSASALGANGLVVFAADQEELENDDVSSTIRAWHAPLEALRAR